MPLHREHYETLLNRPLQHNRDRDSFAHAQEISKGFGMLESVLDWCKSELVNEWRWQLVDVSSNQRPGRYVFYFDSERDYLAFVMKWS
jgi:hypothetical protein